jgi:hypothetical protein
MKQNALNKVSHTLEAIQLLLTVVNNVVLTRTGAMAVVASISGHHAIAATTTTLHNASKKQTVCIWENSNEYSGITKEVERIISNRHNFKEGITRKLRNESFPIQLKEKKIWSKE